MVCNRMRVEFSLVGLYCEPYSSTNGMSTCTPYIIPHPGFSYGATVVPYHSCTQPLDPTMMTIMGRIQWLDAAVVWYQITYKVFHFSVTIMWNVSFSYQVRLHWLLNHRCNGVWITTFVKRIITIGLTYE